MLTSLVIVCGLILIYIEIKQVIKLKAKIKFLKDVYELKNQILEYLFINNPNSSKKVKIIQALKITNHDIYRLAIKELKYEHLIEESTHSLKLTSIGIEYASTIFQES